jgi:hypothetical protein
MVTFEGDHNSNRPQFFYDSVSIFLYQALQCEQLLCSDNKFTQQEMVERRQQIRAEKKKKREIQKLKEDIKGGATKKQVLNNDMP